jgi:hypothetical protein
MTRSSRYKVKDHPTTTVRMPGGVCVECYGAGIPPCKGCGVPLRLSSTPAHMAPGTKQRKAEGMCKMCWLLHHPEQAVVDYREAEEVEEVTPEKLAHTIRGLEAYMARRRERLAS